MFVLQLSIFVCLSGVIVTQDCYCFTANAVNVRDAPCGNVIGEGNSGQCMSMRAGSQLCNLGGVDYTFVEMDFNGQSGWAADDFLTVGNCPADIAPGICGNVNIISRAQWGARAPTSAPPLTTPVSQVFIHHTVTSGCETQEVCYGELQGIQNYHMDTLGWRDIGYNFLVAKDGQAYEGTGFDIIGTHTGSCNSISVAVSMLGNFDADGGEQPNEAILSAIRNIIDCAVQQGHVVDWSQFNLYGHRQACATACPGSYAYAQISTWPWFNAGSPGCGC